MRGSGTRNSIPIKAQTVNRVLVCSNQRTGFYSPYTGSDPLFHRDCNSYKDRIIRPGTNSSIGAAVSEPV